MQTAAVCGGAVLGTIAMTKLRTNGTVLGISGIVGGLVKPGAQADRGERAAFLVGLLSAGAALAAVAPAALGARDATATFTSAHALRVAGAFSSTAFFGLSWRFISWFMRRRFAWEITRE